jgi:hypothetical protein
MGRFLLGFGGGDFVFVLGALRPGSGAISSPEATP